MKRSGILNPALCELLASSGHTDYFTVSDRGFPVPDGVPRIDLALVDGIPTVLDVLRAVHTEWTIDRVVIASEMDLASPGRVAELEALLGPDVPLERMPHLELKQLAQTAKATVRTGDSVPYANIIVVSG
jgi:D-ribose pyranase